MSCLTKQVFKTAQNVGVLRVFMEMAILIAKVEETCMCESVQMINKKFIDQ